MAETLDVQTALQQVERLSETVDENAAAGEELDELQQFLADVQTALAVAETE